MSKHKRHRTNENSSNNSNRNMNNNNNSNSNSNSNSNPNNPLNMNNLSELLKNTDMNQLSAMLASLTQNQPQGGNAQGEPEASGSNQADNTGRTGNMPNMSGNRDLMLLSALKPFLTPQKAELLDRFIELYAQSENRNLQGNR